MRIAMIGLRAPWGTEGGVERSVAELAPRLAALGHEVTVFCRGRYNALGEGMHQGVRLVDVGTVYTKHLEAFVHTGRAMPQAIAAADLVHVHAMGPALWSWMPRLRGRATVVTVHGVDWQREKWGPAARLALRGGAWSAARFSHRVIVVGHHLAEHYQQRYGIDCTWVPNGVAPIPRVPLEQAGLPGLQPYGYLLMLGRLVPEKGVEGLLAAYGRSGLSLPLVIVGGSSYSADYVEHLKAAAPPGVVFAGPLYDARRDALLTWSRALVLPSRLEGFPLAPLESLAAARPVLLSDIPPHRELLEGLGAGWLVPEAEADWVAALRRVAAASPEELQHRGDTGQRAVSHRFSWDAVTERTLEVYDQALRASGRAGGLPARGPAV